MRWGGTRKYGRKEEAVEGFITKIREVKRGTQGGKKGREESTRRVKKGTGFSRTRVRKRGKPKGGRMRTIKERWKSEGRARSKRGR